MLERVDRTKNMARYYVLSVEPTLFAESSLVRRWGRIGGGYRKRTRIDLHMLPRCSRKIARSRHGSNASGAVVTDLRLIADLSALCGTALRKKPAQQAPLRSRFLQ